MRKVALVAALLSSIAAACRDPGGSDTTESTTAASTEVTPTTGDSASHEICDRYLACVAAVAPAGLPGAQMGFGESGTCWQGSPQDAELCLTACKAGLEMYLLGFPDEQACMLCQEDVECDTAAGERCQLGKCTVTSCGDGVLDDDEVCDGQPGCDPDCLGPATCNLFSGVGCTDEACLLLPKDGQTLDAQCDGDGELNISKVCGLSAAAELCRSGFVCTHPTLLASCVADSGDGCCLRLCDMATHDCLKGETCVPYKPPSGYLLTPELGYLGVCVPA